MMKTVVCGFKINFEKIAGNSFTKSLFCSVCNLCVLNALMIADNHDFSSNHDFRKCIGLIGKTLFSVILVVFMLLEKTKSFVKTPEIFVETLNFTFVFAIELLYFRNVIGVFFQKEN